MSHIDTLLADLESEGTVDSQGGFTLDREKAREKMRQFQLADPREYLLQLIRAAHLLGATRIHVEVDADDMHMTFDGRPFKEADFEELYDALFGRADDPAVAARRHLALGLNAALGLDPRRIVVDSGAARLQVAPGEDDDWGPLDPPIDGTRIHARDRFRFANIVRFFQGMGNTLPERNIVYRRCGFSPVRISINDQTVPPRRDILAAANAAFAERHLDGAWAYGGPTRPGEPGKVEIVAGGISICSLPVDGLDGFRGAASSPRLRTDVSQAAVIRDAALDTVLSLVRTVRRDALTALVEAGDADAFLDAEIAAATNWENLAAKHGATFAQAMATRPFGRTLAGDPICIADLPASDPIECIRDGYATRCAALGVDPPARFRAMFHLPAGVEPLPEVRIVDRTADLSIWLDREERRQDFRRRHAQPTLQTVDALARAQIAADDWRGELIITRSQHTAARLDWILDGCLLASRTANLRIPGVHVVIEGPIAANDDFTDVIENDAYRAGAALIGAALGVAIGRLPHTPIGLATQRQWLRMGTAMDPALLTAQRLGGPTAERSVAWLRWRPDSKDPIADAPLFPTVADDPVSLRDLKRQIAAGQKIEHVGPKAEPIATQPPVLAIERADRELLCTIFGAANMRSGRRRLERARRRARFEAQPSRRPNLDFDTAGIGPRHRFEGGIIGLRLQAGRSPQGLRYKTPVQPFVGGRPVEPVDLRLRLPSLVAAIEVGEQSLDADFKALRDPPLDWIGARLAAQIDPLFRPGVDETAARTMLRAVIDLLVPTEAHRDAWYRWDDPAAYRRLLRVGWRDGPMATAKTLADRAPIDADCDAPADPTTEATLAPFFETDGDLAQRLRAAFPMLASAPTVRQLRGGAISLADLCAAIDVDGLVLHASRASVIPDSFDGVALKTEHAQLERLVRLLGDEAIQKATAWKATYALERALAAAPTDPGGLDPARVIGIVDLEGGQLGLRVPFDSDAPSVVLVALDGRIVDRVEVRSPVPIMGYVRPVGEVRLTLRKRRLAIDDLARVRVAEAARNAVNAALREAARGDLTPDHEHHLLTALRYMVKGRPRRKTLETDRVVRALASAPLFPALSGSPRSLFDLITHRDRRKPLSVTHTADVPPPRDPEHLVLHLDHGRWSALDDILGRGTEPYAETLAERARAEAFHAQPTTPLALPDATYVEEISEGSIRGLVGWGGGRDEMIVLRGGRPLGMTPLRLGLGPFSAIVDDPEAPPTPEWDDVAETPRTRRLRRICAEAVPSIAARLATEAPDAARQVLFGLLRCAFPTARWIALYHWLHAEHDAYTGEDLYRDALRAVYQGTPRVLRRIVERAPIKLSALLDGVDRPTGAGVDASVRATFGGQWPLAGDPGRDPLERLIRQLGPLAQVPVVHNDRGDALSLAALAERVRLPFEGEGDRVWRCEPPDHDLLVALLGHRTAAAADAADDARRTARAAAFQAELTQQQQAAEQARIAREAAAAEARAEAFAERQRQEAERRTRQLAAKAQAQREAAERARAAKEAEAAARAAATPPPPAPDPIRDLVERVLAVLHAIQADHPRLLAEANLARLSTTRGGPLAQADDDVLAINLDHPTAQAAIAGDRVASAMVTSAVYTALNLWLDAITDDHEVRFVALLADRALA